MFQLCEKQSPCVVCAVTRYYGSKLPDESVLDSGDSFECQFERLLAAEVAKSLGLPADRRSKFESILAARIAEQLTSQKRSMGFTEPKCRVTLFGQSDVSVVACLAEAGYDRKSVSHFQRGVTMLVYEDRAYTVNHVGSITRIYGSIDCVM